MKRKVTMLPHNRPTFGKEEEQAAIRVIRSGWVAQGKEVDNFEDEFCKFLGLPNKHAVALSSGTAALFMALWALSAKKKKVAFPVYACAALRNAVGLIAAKEILIDVAAYSPNIDLEKLKQSNADIAIVPHMFGLPVDFSGINNMDVIEDCAQALGAMVNRVNVGLQGKAAIYSFYATKLITSGGYGGMFVSKDKSLVDAVRDYREFDQRRDFKKRFNFQMTDLQAAVGREQLRKLLDFLMRRSQIFERYRAGGIRLLDSDKSNKNLKPVRYRAIALTASPQNMITALEKAGVKAIVPIADWELLGKPESFPSALKLTQETVSLPVYPSLSDNDVQKIISVVMNQ